MLLTFAAILVYGIHKYPISFTLSQSEIHDEVYETHDKTYRNKQEQNEESVELTTHQQNMLENVQTRIDKAGEQPDNYELLKHLYKERDYVTEPRR